MKTLLVYVSKTGVTASVADDLKKHARVQIKSYNLSETAPESINDYDTVIIGAPVYMGRAHKTMRKWVKQHQSILAQKKLFFYIVGADETVELDVVLKASYPDTLIDCASMKTHCGGAFKFDRMNRLHRLLIKLVIKKKQKDLEDPIMPSLNNDEIMTFIDAVSKQ